MSKGGHALLYTHGQATDLGTLGGSSSYATSVNSSGQVVGISDTASGAVHAFLFQNGVMTDLGTLGSGGLQSDATGINEKGQITGYALTSANTSRSVLFENGGLTDLGEGSGKAINDRGQVIGIGTANHAVLFSGGMFTDLTPLSHTRYNAASALNTKAKW